jgi:shikimate dehydrogenase
LLSDAAERARTRLGVLGWPVAHSLSPAMQNAALEAAGLGHWRYQLLPAPAAVFDEVVGGLGGAGFRGANVTIPHKRAALALAGTASERARAIGAANTLVFSADGTIEAENTDAPALIQSLPFTVAGRSALVLGAGGSARAAVWGLLDAGASEVAIWNRTAARARSLAGDLGAHAVTDVAGADVLVNCTAVGLDQPEHSFDQLPVSAERLSDFGCVVDLVYGRRATALIEAARERSVPVVDGLELLIAQGALSFREFTGIDASREAMRVAVRTDGAS